MDPKMDSPEALINSQVSSRFGAGPSTAAQGEDPASKSGDDKTRAAFDKATAPKGDGEATGPSVIKIPIKRGDQVEEAEYTPDQLSHIVGRYNDLNFRQGRTAPVIKLAEALMKQTGLENDPDGANKLAQLLGTSLQQAVAARKGQGQSQKNKEPVKTVGEEGAGGFDWDAWGSSNEIDPTPFRVMSSQNQQLMQSMQQLAQMFQASMQAGQAASATTTQAAERLAGATAVSETDAMRRHVMNNLNRVQNEFRLGDDMQKPFMDFAAQRGATTADFADYDFLKVLVGDFVRQRNEGNYQLLEQTLGRRSAITGAAPAQASGGGAAASPGGGGASPDEDFMARMVASKMGR